MALNFDAIIFDLDGTLWDTCSVCAIGWNNVVKRNNIIFREITAEDVRGVTGLPHAQCIKKVFAGLPESQINVLIAGTETEDNLIVEKLGGVLYPGVESGIMELAAHLPLFIVSNCQSGYIETFLGKTGFQGFFKDFECWGNTGKPKGSNLEAIIRRNGLKRPVFVGDTEGDQKAAFECDVPFWFVSYGFGQCSSYSRSFSSFEELKSAVWSSAD